MPRFRQPPEDRVRRAKEQFREQLLANPTVVSVGVGKHPSTGEIAVSIGVDRPVNLDDVLPPTFPADIPAFVEETGPVQPFQTHTDRLRPVPLGVSTGTGNVTGTTSFILDDGSQFYLASNNHVYANNESHGDPILQPGPADGGGAPDDTIGSLSGFVTLVDDVTADVAWTVPEVELDNTALGVAVPSGSPLDPAIDETITKAGRSTGVTSAPVTNTHVDVKVGYSFGDVIVGDCFATEARSQGGDSGSPGLGTNDRPAGVLFAGSDTQDFYNYASNWELETGMAIVTDPLTWDPSAVVVDGCSFSPATADLAEPTQIDLSAIVRNPNGVGVTFDIAWTASGTEFARLPGVSLPANSSNTFVMTYDTANFSLGTGNFQVSSEIPTTTVVQS